MVQINGQAYEAANKTVEKLIQELGYDLRTIAVEINEEIVPKATYSNVKVSDGDVIEVVSFVGGG